MQPSEPGLHHLRRLELFLPANPNLMSLMTGILDKLAAAGAT
jgi:hypothetical protein